MYACANLYTIGGIAKMTFNSILSFSVDALAEYVQSGVLTYVVMPIFCLALVIMLIRVVKYLCMI